MGQRSQQFIRTNTHQGTHTVGTHTQWLYACGFINQLKNVLEFNTKMGKSYRFSDEKNYYFENKEIENLIQSLIAVNQKTGFTTRVTSLNDELGDWDNALNPEYQDNNDGQFFIDFTCGGKPKIAIVFPRESYSDEYIKFAKWEVISPRDYLSLYYNTKEDLEEETVIKTIKAINWINRNTKTMTQDEFFKFNEEHNLQS